MARASAEDEALEAHAEDAGYRWAESHAIDRTDACDGLTPAFRRGCVSWVHETVGKSDNDK